MAIAYPTFSEIIQEVIKQMSMVSGTSVQTYAEDIIASYVQSSFVEIFDSYFWPEYTSWQTYTLDGTVGIPNADIDSTLTRIEDIDVMYVGGTDTRITGLPTDKNPNLITGTTPKHFTPYGTNPSRVFQIFPNASTGTVVARVRTFPVDTFVDDDEIKIDKWMLVFKAAWLYAEQDAANPGQAAMFQTRFEQRIEQRRTNISMAVTIPLSGASGVPSTWQG